MGSGGQGNQQCRVCMSMEIVCECCEVHVNKGRNGKELKRIKAVL